MAKTLSEKLRESMLHAEDWEKRKTPIPGIFVVKVPDKTLRIKLEFNTPDPEGNPTKRRGMYFDDARTLEAAKLAFANPKLKELLDAVGSINKVKPGAEESEEERIEF
jgi:hypothetical protein